jgi:hypothetical protein
MNQLIAPPNIKFEFARARTALKFGLIELQVQRGFTILVPDYLCSVVWDPLLQLGLKIQVYPTLDNFQPDWAALENIQSINPAWGLMMVHYFGQPQPVEIFRRFSLRHGLKLIEDVAHGHSGKYHGINLGFFGDIGISSPRKILNESFGACLFIKASIEGLNEKIETLSYPPSESPIDMLKSFIRRNPRLYAWIKGVTTAHLDWSDPLLFQESIKPDWRISSSVSAKLYLAPWEEIAKRRRSIWQNWQEFAVNNGLEPVFDGVHLESCPWALPVYAKNLTERNRWLVWGAREGVPLFTWPTLSNEVINTGGPAYMRWQKLLCFPLDFFPAKYKDLKIERQDI